MPLQKRSRQQQQPKTDQPASRWVRVTGLWAGKNDSLTGKVGGLSVVIVPAKEGAGKNDPDYVLYVVVDGQPAEGGQRELFD